MNQSTNPPLILIPGLTGTRLQTQYKSNNNYDIWVSLEAMTSFLEGVNPIPNLLHTDVHHTYLGWNATDPARLPAAARYGLSPGQWWLDQMTLDKDGITPLKTPMYNRPVEGLDGVSVLDSDLFYQTWYLYYVIQKLNQIGYTDANLAAAPYDWRLPPAGLTSRYGYFASLKAKIEHLVASHPTQAPAIILAHSLGNRVTQYFLQVILHDPTAGQAWIDQHIGRYIAVSPPWLGAPGAIRQVVSDAYKVGPLSLTGMKSVFQSFGVFPWVFPVTQAQYSYFNTESFAFLNSDVNPLDIVSTLNQGGANNTVNFLNQYYVNDRNFTDPTLPNPDCGNLVVEAPSVPRLDVFYATGQDTEVGAYYTAQANDGLTVDTDATSSDKNFEVQKGIRLEVSGTTRQSIDQTQNSGDGTVPYGSLVYFKQWQQHSPNTIQGHEIPGSEHTAILGKDKFLAAIATLITGS